MRKLLPEKNIHLIFEASILAKGALAMLEIIAGAFVFFLHPNFLPALADRLTRNELAQDADDFIANSLLHIANGLTINGKYFIAIYLASHGIIKLGLIIALLKNKLWAYPLSFAVFSFFGIYQMYRYYFTHSTWLVLFTVLDILVIILVVHEYIYIKKHRRLQDQKEQA